MKNKSGIIVIILSCAVFFGVFAVSYYMRNYTEIEPDIILTESSVLPSENQSIVSSGNTTEAVSAEPKSNGTKPALPIEENVSTAKEMPSAREIPYYIDINTASREELMDLSGIGEILADAIIAYREQYGAFANPEEIMQVSGIGEGIFAAIADRIYVQDPQYPVDPQSFDDEIYEENVYDETNAAVQDNTEKNVPELEEVIPIDLNTADAELLMLLPYVDEAVAKEIIELREKIGGFSNTYELLYTESLNRRQVAEISGYVTVGEK